MPVLQVLLLKLKIFLVDPMSCLQLHVSVLNALWPPASSVYTLPWATSNEWAHEKSLEKERRVL